MPHTARHDEIVARARRVLAADPRIVATWLEGSLVAGTADRWSDVDLHVAVAPEPHELVLGTVLGELRAVCDQHGVPWPADHETQVRSFLCDEMGLGL